MMVFLLLLSLLIVWTQSYHALHILVTGKIKGT
jgi:hypothetical protein